MMVSRLDLWFLELAATGIDFRRRLDLWFLELAAAGIDFRRLP